MKACTKCGVSKAAEDFYPDKSRRDGRRSSCKACAQAARATPEHKRWQSAYWSSDKGRAATRKYRLKALYDLTPAQAQQMAADQQGRCAICGAADSALVVDHDHRTRKVRGLLCAGCNHGLGKFRDSPAALRMAALYLEAHCAV